MLEPTRQQRRQAAVRKKQLGRALDMIERSRKKRRQEEKQNEKKQQEKQRQDTRIRTDWELCLVILPGCLFGIGLWFLLAYFIR